MANLTTRQIREMAQRVLEEYPQGLNFSSLVGIIQETNPETNENTIYTQVGALAREFSR